MTVEPQPGDPAVLFVNIGWADRYDGTETIVGNHKYLQAHGDDSSERWAFAEDEHGVVKCWIGRGAVNVARVDIVFVARPPGELGHRVVGIYFDARIHDWTHDWADSGASTADYVLFAPEERTRVEWPGRMSMRRWAYRAGGSGTEHETLYRAYRALLDDLGRVPGDSSWDTETVDEQPNLSPLERVSVALGEDPDEVCDSPELLDRADEQRDTFKHSHFCALDPHAAKLVGFQPGQRLLDALRALLLRDDIVSVRIASFASNPAFFELAGLVRLVRRGRLDPKDVRLLFAPPAGCDLSLATWLRRQADLGRLSVREFSGLGTRAMHVKLLLAEVANGQRIAFVGSANATFAGLAMNEEMTCAFTPGAHLGDSDPYRWFDEAWDRGAEFHPSHFVLEEVTIRRRPLFEFQLDAQAALDRHILPLLDLEPAPGEEGDPGGHGGSLLVLPTGAGKTLTATRWLFNRVLPDPALGRVLWLSHRRELLQHAHDTALGELHFASGRQPKIVAYGIDERPLPSHGPLDEGDLLFISSQRAHSALKRLGRRKKPDFGLIVIDEAHRASSSTRQYGELLSLLPHRARIGLTATPYRGTLTDARRFARVFTLQEDEDRLRPTVVFSRSVEEIEATRMPGDARLFAHQRHHTIETGFRLQLAADNEAQFARSLGEFDTAARNAKVVDAYMKQFAHSGPAIIFCLNRLHANKIAAAINRRGGAAQAFHDGEIPERATTHRLRRGTMNIFDRARVLQEYRDGAIRVLCCVQLLTEGFDLPEISSVLLARPTMSTLLLTQMIGRGLRGPAVGGSETCDIVDFSDQLEIHKKRDREARLRVARPSDADAFRRGQLPEQDGIPA